MKTYVLVYSLTTYTFFLWCAVIRHLSICINQTIKFRIRIRNCGRASGCRWQIIVAIIDCLACDTIFGIVRVLTSSANFGAKKSVLAGKLKDVGYRQSWPALEKNILLSKFWQQKATLAEKLEDVSKRESWPMTHARRRFRGRKIPADTSDVFCSLSLSRT